jgi:hypothetical protein
MTRKKGSSDSTGEKKLKRKNRESEPEEDIEVDATEHASTTPKKQKGKAAAEGKNAKSEQSKKKGASDETSDAGGADVNEILGSTTKSALAGISFKKKKPYPNQESSEFAPGPADPETALPMDTSGSPTESAPLSAIAARKLREPPQQQQPTPTIPLPPKPASNPPPSLQPSAPTRIPRSKFDMPPSYKSKPRDPEAPDTDRVPKKLTFHSTPWSDSEIETLKSALKKYGIPAPSLDSLRKEGLWYSAVGSWERVAEEVGGRRAVECRFMWFGVLGQVI